MSVPVRNFYRLLCYAWDMLEEAGVADVSQEDFETLPDLFARVLEEGTMHLLKRGLDRGYLDHYEETSCPRGKIDLSATVKTGLIARRRVGCHVDDLSRNVLHNRILKSTILRLAHCDGIDTGLRRRLVRVHRRLEGVSEIPLTLDLFGRVVLHRNNAYYGFLLRVCRLVFDNLIVDDRTGRSRFRDFLRDERAMARLFEAFVRNFYRLEQTTFRVKSERIDWYPVEAAEADRAFLPAMRTDVSLISPARKIILDTKYYARTLQAHHAKETVHSENLYQLYAYLQNSRFLSPSDERIEGVLLYPTVGQSLDLRYVIQGHPVRIATVDLAGDWPGIRKILLGFLD